MQEPGRKRKLELPAGQLHTEQKVKKALDPALGHQKCWVYVHSLPLPSLLKESTGGGKVAVTPGNPRKQELKLVWEGRQAANTY